MKPPKYSLPIDSIPRSPSWRPCFCGAAGDWWSAESLNRTSVRCSGSDTAFKKFTEKPWGKRYHALYYWYAPVKAVWWSGYQAFLHARAASHLCNPRDQARYAAESLAAVSGHARSKTTMDRYVQVTDESVVKAVRQFEQATPAGLKKRRKKGVKGCKKGVNKIKRKAESP